MSDYFSEKSIDELSSCTEAWKLLGEEFIEFIKADEEKKKPNEETQKQRDSREDIYFNSPLREQNSPYAQRNDPAYPFAPRYPGLVVKIFIYFDLEI